MLVLTPGVSKVTHLAFAQSGRLLAAAGGRSVVCWSLDRPDAPLCHWVGATPVVPAFASDAELLIADVHRLTGVDPHTSAATDRQAGGPLQGHAGGLAVSRDGGTVVRVDSALSTDRPAYRCWRHGKLAWAEPADGFGQGRAVGFLADVQHVVAAESNRHLDGGRVRYGVLGVRDATTGELVKQHAATTDRLGGLAAHPATRQTVAIARATLAVWDDPVAGSFTREVRSDNRKHFTGVAYHPDGRRLFATANDETVRVYDTASWAVTATYTWGVGKLLCVAVSPDGTVAAAGGDAGRVVVWDVDG